MTDDRTADSRRNWEGAAAGWASSADLVARTSEPVTRWMLHRLGPKPGQTILELGAGTGDVGFEVATLVGRHGRVVSTDFVPQMIETAKQRGAAAGVDNVEFREMDAQKIDLPDTSVDGVVHRFGPMLLPDPAASAREVRRVIMRGGGYVTAIWAKPELNPMFPLLGRTLASTGLDPHTGPNSDDGPPPLFAPGALEALMREAGFDEVHVEEVDSPFVFSHFEELWRIPTEIAGPIAAVIRGLGPIDHQRVKDAIREAAEPYRTGDGYNVPACALCSFAR